MRNSTSLFIALFLIAVMGVPALTPFLALLEVTSATSSDLHRYSELLGRSLALVVGAVLIAALPGIPLGIALATVRLRFRLAVWLIVTTALFVPLPVWAIAWQVIFGQWVPVTTGGPGPVVWRPFSMGLLPAMVVHGLYGVAWIAMATAIAVQRIDQTLMERALAEGGLKQVYRLVVAPPSLMGGMVGAACVAVQTLTEIPVTDLFAVRTVAEETYTQLVIGSTAGVTGAVLATLPLLVLAAIGTVITTNITARRFPAHTGMATGGPLSLSIPMAGVLVWVTILFVFVLPGIVLIGKAANGSVLELASNLQTRAILEGHVLAESLLVAGAAGVLAAGFAGLAATVTLRSRTGTKLFSALAILLWLTPGPLVGLGLKLCIAKLLTFEHELFLAMGVSWDFPPLRTLLYDQPSPLPALWAWVIRFFPVAYVFVFAATRRIPQGLLDQATVDGLTLIQLLNRIVLPLAGNAAMRGAVAVAALALGEISSCKFVLPPGQRLYSLEMFAQMHYGTDATVCGLCLVQLLTTGLIVMMGLTIFKQK